MVLPSGCASTSPDDPFRNVAAMVEQRTGHTIYWNRGTPEDARVGFLAPSRRQARFVSRRQVSHKAERSISMASKGAIRAKAPLLQLPMPS